MLSNRRVLDKVARAQGVLSRKHGENNLFISQFKENPRDEATVIISLTTKEKGEAYLAFRRLLTAFAYRVSESTDFDLSFSLKHKKKRKEK